VPLLLKTALHFLLLPLPLPLLLPLPPPLPPLPLLRSRRLWPRCSQGLGMLPRRSVPSSMLSKTAPQLLGRCVRRHP
jgi:hypothetical protein